MGGASIPADGSFPSSLSSSTVLGGFAWTRTQYAKSCPHLGCQSHRGSIANSRKRQDCNSHFCPAQLVLCLRFSCFDVQAYCRLRLDRSEDVCGRRSAPPVYPKKLSPPCHDRRRAPEVIAMLFFFSQCSTSFRCLFLTSVCSRLLVVFASVSGARVAF